MTVWSHEATHPVLGEDEIHLWRLRADPRIADGDGEERIAGMLNDEERARATRYLRARDRRLWAWSRAWLRSLLAEYLAVAPVDVELLAGPMGKPVAATRVDRSLQFSLAHADDVVLVGVARFAEIGVDVERIRGDLDLVGIAKLVLAHADVDELERLSASGRAERFAELWVAGEARRKCLGIGFRAPLPESGPLPMVRSVDFGPGFAAAWACRQVPLRARYFEGRWEAVRSSNA